MHQALRDAGSKTPGQDVRELRDFYELDDCLWITIADGHLWWAYGIGAVEPTGDNLPDRPVRFRRALDGWHRENMRGEPLALHSLSSALTKMAAYRRTICSVKQLDHLLRKLRGDDLAIVMRSRQLRADLEVCAAQLIEPLDPRDFEILVDLIFTRGGWQRLSAVGHGEADLDLLLTNPTINELAWVQVKSSADQRTLDDYRERFLRHGTADRFYFVCHSPHGPLTMPEIPGWHLLTGADLARSALLAGLLDWLIARAR